MAYSNFTLETVQKTFQLEKIESTDIFSHIEPVEPSEDLTKELAKKVTVSNCHKNRESAVGIDCRQHSR